MKAKTKLALKSKKKSLSVTKYQLSYGTKLPYILQLRIVWPIFLSWSTTFGYAQPWWAGVNQCPSGYGPHAIKQKTSFKNHVFGYFGKFQNVKKPLQNILFSQLGQKCIYIRLKLFFLYWFSTLPLFTFKSCYRNTVLTSAWLSFGSVLL